MAARKRKSKQRRKKQPISMLNMAEAALMGNAITTGLFDAGLVDFFTGRMDGEFRAGSDGGQRLTLPEILGFGQGGFGGTYGSSGPQSIQEAIRFNFNNQGGGVNMIMQIITIPIAFKLTKKFARKPLNMANKGLRQLGIKEVKI